MNESIVYGSGLFRIMLWQDSAGKWHFDGPASSGPKHVRESGRGPHWRGEVSPQFAQQLKRRIRRALKSPS